jgi:hypothetical protein
MTYIIQFSRVELWIKDPILKISRISSQYQLHGTAGRFSGQVKTVGWMRMMTHCVAHGAKRGKKFPASSGRFPVYGNRFKLTRQNWPNLIERSRFNDCTDCKFASNNP